MNNYLLQLLKEVKTIIIPGLGAITLTNETTGEMMFMPYLKYDDGNLANHIAEKEGMELNDAKNLIAKFVREVTAELDKGNSYDMYQFGSFKKVDGEVDFVQWSAGTAESAPVETTPEPVVVPVVPEVEPEVIPAPEPEPVVEPVPDPIIEPEPIVAPEPIIEPEPVIVPEPEIPAEEEKQEETPISVAELTAAAFVAAKAVAAAVSSATEIGVSSELTAAAIVSAATIAAAVSSEETP